MYRKYLNTKNESQLNEYLDTRRNNLTYNTTKKVLHIIPTLTCFGKCSYCYNKDVIVKEEYDCLSPMKLHSILNSIEDKDIEMIRFYGGEPGLSYEYLYRYIQVVNELSPNLKDVYISSSFLFNDDIFVQFYAQLNNIKQDFPNIKLQVGTTADFGNTPFTRGCHTTKLSREDILYRANMISNLGIASKVNNVLTSFTSLEQFESDLNFCLDEYPNLEIRVVVANEDNFIPSKSDLRKFYFFIKPYVLKYDQIYCNSRYEERLEQTFKLNLDCGIYSNLITIDDKGNQLNCHYKLDKYEELEDSDNFDFMINLNDKCLNCPVLFMCNGGCVLRHNNHDLLKDDIYCYWIKLSVLLSTLVWMKNE